MEGEAVKEIQRSTGINEFIQVIKETDTQIPVVAAPQGISIKTLEDYMPNASRYRQKYQTTSINDYANYCKEFDQEGAKCFVDKDEMVAETIFDLGTNDKPLHSAHRAYLKMKKTNAFQALLYFAGHELSQKSTADFIEDWSDSLVIYTNSGDKIPAIHAAKSIQDLTIEKIREASSKTGNFSEAMSSMEKIEAKNQEKIPAELQFSCIPYTGIDALTFTIKIQLLTSHEKPKIKARIIKLEQIEDEIADEFKLKLTQQLNGLKIKAFIGKV